MRIVLSLLVLIEPGGTAKKPAKAVPSGKPVPAMHSFEVGRKKRLVIGRCGTIGAHIAAMLSDDGFERSHFQQAFAAARGAEAARSATAEADARIGRGDDQVIDQH